MSYFSFWCIIKHKRLSVIDLIKTVKTKTVRKEKLMLLNLILLSIALLQIFIIIFFSSHLTTSDQKFSSCETYHILLNSTILPTVRQYQSTFSWYSNSQ